MLMSKTKRSRGIAKRKDSILSSTRHVSQGWLQRPNLSL